MSSNEAINMLICSALSPICANISEGIYTGNADEYITFTYTTRPCSFGDDEPEYEIYRVSVSLFSRLGINLLAKRRAIKTVLHNAGFTYPQEINATDSSWQQFVFECEVEGVI